MNSNLTTNGYLVSSLEELEKYVPAAFSKSPHPERTDKYSFLSTSELIQNVMKDGWEIYSGKQHGTQEFSRHIIKMNHPKFGYQEIGKDKIRPQILIDNSHNGITKAQIHMGLFRLVCTNGLVVGLPGSSSSVKFVHMGSGKDEILRIIEESSSHYSQIFNRIKDMQDFKMNEDSQIQFAIEAAALREPLRFTENGKVDFAKVTKSLNPQNLVSPIRSEDKVDNLWNIFNIVQEKTVKGMYERKTEEGKTTSLKPILNSARNLDFNKKLWNLAESYMN